MGKDTSLTVSLFGRDVSLGKAMDKVGGSTKSASKAFDDMSKKAAIAFAAISGMAVLAAKNAASDAASQRVLALTLKNTANATDEQIAATEEYINKTSLALGIADDKLRPAFARLTRSTNDVAESQKLMNLALDISASTGKPVEDIANALDDTAESYKLDRMRGQDSVIEVWTEKDALSGIFKRSTQKYHVRLCVNKGYTSSSAIYKSYQRVKNIIISGKAFVILYFGDHDPSGLDMIRDIRDRIEYFLSNGSLQDNEYFYDKVQNWWDENEYDIYNLVGSGFLTEKQCDEIMKSEGDIKDELMKAWESARIRLYINQNNLFAVNPIGLTIEQIKQYDLPPNPTKLTDSRAKGYIAKFGQTCWEVDALEPQVLTDIVESNIESLINVDLYESVLQEESEERTEVEKIAEQYRTNN